MVAASPASRGKAIAAGVPPVEHFLELGSWFAGTPDDLVAMIKGSRRNTPAWST